MSTITEVVVPGYMLAVGDTITKLQRNTVWSDVNYVLKSVRVWKDETTGYRWVTFVTEAGTEMTYKSSDLFHIQYKREEE